MKWDVILRSVGIVGIIGAYGLFVVYGDMTYPLVVAVMGIVALVSPEAIDALPFGPTKNN